MSESQVQEVVEKLKSAVAEKGFVDIGEGAVDQFAVSPSELAAAVALLQQEEDLTVHKYRVQQLDTDNFVTITVLQSSDAKYKDIFEETSRVALRSKIAALKAATKERLLHDIYSLRDDGMSNRQIAKTLSISESTIRSWLTIDKVEEKENLPNEG